MNLTHFNPSALADSPEPVAVMRAGAGSERPGGQPPIVAISRGQNERMIRARFDSQFTTDENQRHWALADAMSVDAAANPGVLRLLRMRNRYEYHNNAWYMKAANNIANYVIGTGPRLQMATKNKKLNKLIENLFGSWAREVGLARKLRTSRAARVYNGAGYLILRTNPRMKHPVKLDLHEVEADQVTNPSLGLFPAQYADQYFDGVELDKFGNPKTYYVLPQHPGAFGAFLMLATKADPVPAEYVLHDYGHIRPAQQQGVPEANPALELFAELRRYRGSTLAAADTAAEYAGFIKTTAAATEGDAPTAAETGFGTDMDYVNTKRRMMGVLPEGWEPFQMRAEQPTTTFDSFSLMLLCEISAAINTPLFVLTGDARLANMSSAYVAMQPFQLSVRVDREDNYHPKLDKTFDQFIAEARLVPGLLPRDTPAELPHVWRWDRIGNHADPQKTALGQQTRLETGSSSLDIECASDGLDPDQVEEDNAKRLDMSITEYRAAKRQKLFAIKGNPAPATVDPEKTPVTDEEEPDNTVDDESGEAVDD